MAASVFPYRIGKPRPVLSHATVSTYGTSRGTNEHVLAGFIRNFVE